MTGGLTHKRTDVCGYVDMSVIMWAVSRCILRINGWVVGLNGWLDDGQVNEVVK